MPGNTGVAQGPRQGYKEVLENVVPGPNLSGNRGHQRHCADVVGGYNSNGSSINSDPPPLVNKDCYNSNSSTDSSEPPPLANKDSRSNNRSSNSSGLSNFISLGQYTGCVQAAGNPQ